MSLLEGQLEKWRRALSLRPDFNLKDLFKLLVRDVSWKKVGIEVDDLLYTLKYTLGFTDVSRDLAELVFNAFCVTRGGYWGVKELHKVFTPNEHHYAV